VSNVINNIFLFKRRFNLKHKFSTEHVIFNSTTTFYSSILLGDKHRQNLSELHREIYALNLWWSWLYCLLVCGVAQSSWNLPMFRIDILQFTSW